MHVTLRKLTPADFPVTTLWRNANREHFPPQPEWTIDSQYYWYYMTYVHRPAEHLFIVEADGRAAGTIGFNTRTREIGQVLLGEQACRGKGVMTAALLELYAAFGDGYYWLKVLRGNERAIAFYRSAGFRPLGHAPVSLHDGLDWVVMSNSAKEAGQ